MLTVKSLSSSRGGRQLFENLSFTLDAGNILFVTGANGSGKSSLLRVLAKLLPPTDGSVNYSGPLHYIGHQDAAKPELTVQETLNYWRVLSGAQPSAFIDAFGILSLADRPVRLLSAGQKRQLALTRLFLSHAPLWLLDEPTAALDAAAQDILLGQIAKHRANGGLSVIATHQDLPLTGVTRIHVGGA